MKLGLLLPPLLLLLAPLLLAAALRRASAALPIVNEADCPKWVREYAAFHTATRGRGDAKYISLLCNGTEVDGGGCHGAGAAPSSKTAGGAALTHP